MKNLRQHIGVFVAISIVAGWTALLFYAMQWKIDYKSPWLYIMVLLQMHLYTGLFITAHDAMHGTVSANKKVNHGIGHLTALLFSFNFYHRLFPKHHEHHRFVATDKDPDYYKGGFWPWYFSFIKQYISWQQLLLMAISFHLLRLVLPTENLIIFWMLPAILSTFQLFYFGTYLPHKGSHDPENKYFSHSQKKNHLWAFLSCYFFGYHYEHHASPGTPWWKLYKVKEKFEMSR